jgi:hypothetical protein
VSNLGCIKNNGKILRPSTHRSGYVRIHLNINSISTSIAAVHILVAQAFIPNPENKPYVNVEPDPNEEWREIELDSRKFRVSSFGRIQLTNGEITQVHCI